jgi:hypothetical protein
MNFKSIPFAVSIACVIAFPPRVHSFSPAHPARSGIQYLWTSSDYGGGGYVTGIIQHPANPDILYIRTDVAGVFMSEDGGRQWKAVNNGMTEGYHHNVESFAMSVLKHRRGKDMDACHSPAGLLRERRDKILRREDRRRPV